MKIKTVILPIDGILFTTQQLRQNLWKQILDDHGITHDTLFFIRTIDVGQPEKDHVYFQYYKQKPYIDSVETALLEQIKAASSQDLLKPGSLDFLNFLKRQGIQIALISAHSQEYMDVITAKTETKSFFSTMVSGDEVIEGLPEPHLILKAMHQLNATLEDTLVIEQSRHGLHGAYLANVQTIFLEDIFNKHDHEDLIKYSTRQAKTLAEVETMIQEINHTQ